MLNKTIYGKDLAKTIKAFSEEVYGCCGSVMFYLNAPFPENFYGFNDREDPQILVDDVKKLADYWCKNKSVALIILNEQQRSVNECALKELGFVRTFGPIKNANSLKDLYGYVLNLNVWKASKLKTLKEKKFGKV